MDCPECGAGFGYVSVQGPMVVKRWPAVWRTRHCVECGCKWETVEIHKRALGLLERAAVAGEVEAVKNGFLDHVRRVCDE